MAKRMKWQTFRSLRLSGLLPLLLLTTSLVATPALAGHYEAGPIEGSGTLIRTPGTSSGLGSPEIDQSVGEGGSVSFTYTETWAYTWEPDDEPNDFPEDANLVVNGAATFTFHGTSSQMDYAGYGEGTATFGGNTVTASATYPYLSGYSGVRDGETQSLSVSKSLTGWDGEFQVSYSGSLTTTGCVWGTILISRSAFGQQTARLVYIKNPNDKAPTSGSYQIAPGQTTRTLGIDGVWKPQGTDVEALELEAEYHVYLTGSGISDPPSSAQKTGTLSLIPGNTKRPWRTWGPLNVSYGVGIKVISAVLHLKAGGYDDTLDIAPSVTFSLYQ